jgi:predicted P-loop ATPase
VARSNPFDPVAQWLEGLTWDGTPRVRRAFHQYLNVVEGNPKHVATISEKFFVACVARALEPGCQVDTVLVLQGPQGVGKTSFVRILGGDFAAETSLDVANKDATMILTGSWLVELNELIAMKRSDVESMRAFITRRVDQFRPPYGRAVEHFPRRCVFIGTTNDDQPLNDPDGHRRYWPVMVGSIDRVALQRDRDQLFAEAVHLYRSGVAWWLSDEEALVAAEEAALFERGTLYGEVIDSWFRSLPAKQRPEYVTVLDISERVLRVVGAQVTTLIKNQIGEALTALGFEKSRRQGGDKLRTYLWKVPAYLLRCEQVKSSSLQKLADASFGLQQPKEEV